ncbi:MAG: ABC transporter ATP-binding protein [Armatimonadota bacterium]|nr:ABC transporter ATP-binding protein [Armatimonadota bacterium]MDR7475807.1 ABC transporter ATP-binding protein [Armatimonadota bacterium]
MIRLLREIPEARAVPRRGLIHLYGVRKVYPGRGVVALRGVDLTVGQGEFVAVVGPSGSGKSTLLHLMGALDRPTSGDIYFRGVSLRSVANLAAFRLRTVGFVFQSHHLLPVLTAAENVEVPLIARGVSRRQRRKRAQELLARVGLAHRARHYPGELSGGESQRVAVARALANDPPVILADEPTGELDSATAAEVMEVLAGLHVEGRTLVVATHNPEVVAAAERVIVLRDGRIAAIRMQEGRG